MAVVSEHVEAEMELGRLVGETSCTGLPGSSSDDLGGLPPGEQLNLDKPLRRCSGVLLPLCRGQSILHLIPNINCTHRLAA